MEEQALFVLAERDVADAERSGYSDYSYWGSTIRVFMKNYAAVFCLGLLIVLLVFTMVQPYLPAQRDPNEIHLSQETFRQLRNVRPGAEFWFGTNSIGQDLWARIWSGTRTSLGIGIAVASWNVLIAYMLRPSISTMVIAMGVTGWVPASRCLGTSTGRIITRNILPYLVSVIMLRFALAIPGAIASEVFLTYIGLGLPLHIPSLGNLINEGRQLMMIPVMRYQLIFPSVVVSLITISFYVMGNAFSDAADPRNHV
ncbi:MAG: Dipeptide transport system permease protein DppC [Firmicutes bacterium]|nr:Dipeptide transport system permease protein DppC [Bacillota bacterium]